MCGNEIKDDFVLEYYRNIRERLTSQGNRLWIRFHYFLTVEVALVGAFLATKNGLSEHWQLLLIPFLGLCWSGFWFLIGAQDLWFYEDRYESLRKFENEKILKEIGFMPSRLTKSDIPKFKRFICFKIPEYGVTSLAPIFPILFVLIWILLGVVGWITRS